ncbi:MAG: hypothetical protein HOW73_30475 [Polyangiaceae bacterium]|nr:hypothetical protein [Polyangiaceae bacterium]
MTGPAKRRLLPDWWLAVMTLLGGLFVVFNLIYRFGFGGVSVSGADVSFNREFDGQLWKIDDHLAYRTGKHPDDVAVVRYKSGAIPFRPVCGSCDLDGSLLNTAQFKKGAWVYSEYPELEGVDVVNIETGEKFEVDAKKPEPGKRSDPSTIAFYRDRGLTFDDDLRLDARRVAKEATPLSTINESCIVFNAAFFLLFGLMVVALLLVFLTRVVRRV